MSTDDRLSPLPVEPEAHDIGVLVGYDDSEHAVQALHFAAVLALRAHSRLTVVSAYTVPPMVYPNMASLPPVPEKEARELATRQILDSAEAHLRGYPGEVVLRAVEGDAAGVLVELSSRATVSVVGARGRGGFLGRLLGSVSAALPAHSHCPTIVVPKDYVVPGGTGPERFTVEGGIAPVVLGIDGTPPRELTEVALKVAADAGAPLHLLLVLPPLETWMASAQAMVPDKEILERRREELAEEIRREALALTEATPGVTVTAGVEIGDPAGRLAEHSRTAQLTIVSTRGHGRMVSALLGSVSRGLLERAEGPVMVVPAPDHFRRSPRRPR